MLWSHHSEKIGAKAKLRLEIFDLFCEKKKAFGLVAKSGPTLVPGVFIHSILTTIHTNYTHYIP